MNMGPNSVSFYFLAFDNVQLKYEFRRCHSSDGLLNILFTFTSNSKPIHLFSVSNRLVCGLQNGTVFLASSTEHTILYSHQAPVTYLDLNIPEQLLVSGDSSGTIIVSTGRVFQGFHKYEEYQEHNCSIVSILLHGDYLISSDVCGIIVQYDLTLNGSIDQVQHPNYTGSPVHLSQILDEGVGASAELGSTSIFLYTIDNQTRPYPAQPTQPTSEPQESVNAVNASRQIIVEVAKKIIGIPTLRLYVKFMLPWMIWLEDFYYYSYHQHEYNEGVRVFLRDLFFVNDKKVHLDLITTLEEGYLSKPLRFNTSSYQEYYPIINHFDESNFPMYFLQYTKSLYIEGLIQQVLLFLLLKAGFWALIRCITNPTVKLLLAEFQGNTLVWFFSLSFLTDNALYLSFGCGAQLRTSFSFNFADKANLVTSVIVLFILLTHTVGFFILTHVLYKRKRLAQSALYLSEPCLRSFVMESVIFGGRNILNGFIHGFFLDDHPTQIILLAIVAVLVVLWTCFNYRVFTYRICFALALLYHSGFAVFNIFVLCDLKGIQISTIPKPELDYYLLLALLALVCLRFLAEFFVFFYERKSYWERIKKFIKKHKKQLKRKKANKNQVPPTEVFVQHNRKQHKKQKQQKTEKKSVKKHNKQTQKRNESRKKEQNAILRNNKILPIQSNIQKRGKDTNTSGFKQEKKEKKVITIKEQQNDEENKFRKSKSAENSKNRKSPPKAKSEKKKNKMKILLIVREIQSSSEKQANQYFETEEALKDIMPKKNLED